MLKKKNTKRNITIDDLAIMVAKGFNGVDKRFDAVDKRFNRLFDVFATKEDLEFFKEEMKKSFSDLQTAVDAYAKKADTYFQEMLMLSYKIERHEKWFHQIAEKIGVKLEY